MIIECEDLQALDLLSSPEAISVRLSRNVTCQEYGGRKPTGQKWDDLIEYDESAIWWPALSGVPNPGSGQREVQGEIHLKEDLAPSTKIAHFSIKVCIITCSGIITEQSFAVYRRTPSFQSCCIYTSGQKDSSSDTNRNCYSTRRRSSYKSLRSPRLQVTEYC